MLRFPEAFLISSDQLSARRACKISLGFDGSI